MEVFKDVIGYEGLYKISNLGNVISLNNYRRKFNRLLCPFESVGYKYVSLHNRGNTTRIAIHRLIAIHFIINPENKPMVNHKDGNKQNNNIENLEWCTCKENIQHAYDTGLKKIGVNHIKRTKEVHSKKVINTETKEVFISGLEAAKTTIYSYSYVLSMLNGNRPNKTNLKHL